FLAEEGGDPCARAFGQRVEFTERVFAGDRAVGTGQFDSDQNGAFRILDGRAMGKAQRPTSLRTGLWISYRIPYLDAPTILAKMSRPVSALFLQHKPRADTVLHKGAGELARDQMGRAPSRAVRRHDHLGRDLAQ